MQVDAPGDDTAAECTILGIDEYALIAHHGRVDDPAERMAVQVHMDLRPLVHGCGLHGDDKRSPRVGVQVDIEDAETVVLSRFNDEIDRCVFVTRQSVIDREIDVAVVFIQIVDECVRLGKILFGRILCLS